MLKKHGRVFALCACTPVLVLFAVFFVFPLGVTIVTSTFRWDRMRIEDFVGISNYIRLFQDPVFVTSLKNILSWLFVAVFIHIPFALLIALILSTKMRGWKFLRTAYFIPQIISSVAWATIFISVYNPSYGLLNGVLSLFGVEGQNWLYNPRTAWPAIICTWLFFIGMYSMIMLADLISIPEEIIEAARIDGANQLQIAGMVKVPLIRTVIGTCMVLTVSGGIKHFDSLYLMTNGAPNFRTETLSLYLYQQYTYADFSYANTIGVVLLVLGIMIVSVIRRVMREKE